MARTLQVEGVTHTRMTWVGHSILVPKDKLFLGSNVFMIWLVPNYNFFNVEDQLGGGGPLNLLNQIHLAFR